MPRLDGSGVGSPADAAAAGHERLLRVRAGGTSMVPFISDGDILLVERSDPSALKPGTVVVYRFDSDHMVAHRFMGLARKETATLLKLRGDASAGPFEYVEPEQIVGRVVALQRAAGIRVIDTWYWRRMGLMWARTQRAASLILRPRDLPLQLAASTLLFLQCSRWYRRAAWRLMGKRVRYCVATRDDLRALGMDAEPDRNRAAECPDTGETEGQDIVAAGRATVVARLGKETVGWIAVAKTPDQMDLESYWMITGMRVRDRYRGAGIGRGLLITAGATLVQHGIYHLVASVLEANTGALALADQVGADRPLLSDLISETPTQPGVHEGVTVTRTLEEGLRALHQQGVLEKYRGTGCCDALLEALDAGVPSA
jgi:GNAT superfamily N-acetyltransferase